MSSKQIASDEVIVCDSDTGSDVDDYLALAYLAKAGPERLKLVSTTFGPVELRAKAVSTLFKSMNVDTPVVMGAMGLMTQNKPIWLTGQEDFLVDLDAPISDDGLLEAYLKHDNFTLLAIGPLTNVAELLDHEEFVKRCKRIVIMGGTIHGEILPLEHNFQCDPVATKKVIESSVPKVLIPLELTAPVPMTEEHQDLFRTSTTAYGHLLWRWISNWRKVTNSFWTVTWPDRVEKAPFVPPFYDSVHWHDPIAAAYIFHPDLFTTETMYATVNPEGGLEFSADGAELTVCTAMQAEVIDNITATILGEPVHLVKNDEIIPAEELSQSPSS